jgi:ABC-2 type transport system ATP-binding protein
MTAAIELDELTKDYGTLRALDHVSLKVAPGEIFGFLGPNGAGKTTAIRVLFDLIRPTSGSARVLGFDCQKQSLAARRRMAYLPGELTLYGGLTGRETLDYFLGLRPQRPDLSYVSQLLERMDLDPSRRVSAYSKGNRQKLGLILAMMNRPDVLLLDEPTSGLDPLIQDEVANLLFEAAAEGRTVFFSSHVLSEVERMCHRAAFLRDGRLVAIEDVSALKGRSLHIIEAVFEDAPPRSAFQIDGVREARRDGTSVRLEVQNNLDVAMKAISQYRLADLHTEQPSLEHVFRAYYEEDKGEAVDAAT